MPDAPDLAQLVVEAEDVAAAAGQPLTSAHLLLAAWTLPCPASSLLTERGATVEALLGAMTRAPQEDPAIAPGLLTRTRAVAAGLGANADTLHLLVAISRSPDCLAYDLMQRCGVPLAPLRNTILSWYTVGKVPKHLQARVPASTPAGPTRPVARPSAPPREARPAPNPPPVRSDSPIREESRPEDPPVRRNALDEAPPGRSARPAGRATPGEPSPDVVAAEGSTSRFRLDPAIQPLLCSFGRNLTEAAAQGALDPVIGRDREVDEVVDILGKRRGNNPVLVGEAGVGKTAIVEGVAQRLLEAGDEPRIVVELDMAALTAGTSLRGSFSERLGGIKDEVREAAGRILVFIDELHTVVGAGSAGEGSQDAANELKTALARGEFPCIGATTFDEYRRFIEADPALERRFTAVQVAEPTAEQAAEILAGIAPRYEAHHRVRYEPAALRAAASLTARYVRDRQLPDKAIQAIDLAGSRCRRSGKAVVDVHAVAEVVAQAAKLPLDRLILDDGERLLRLEEELSARVVGHADVIARVARTLRRNYAGFGSHRPMGSFLFLGPTGVGKTELAKAIAEVLFGSQDSLVRFDMSELAEAHGVARLIGAPPGYVGHGEGGQLTEAVRRRPACVLLLDELEKAHRDVQLLLLQILDEGRLADSKGRQVDFSQALVILTSNLGAEAFAPGRGAARVGFTSISDADPADSQAERALGLARGQLPPELWNRIDERCVFLPLERDQVGAIARLLVSDSAARLERERGIRLAVPDEVIEHLVAAGGFDVSLGARPMRQLVQRRIEAPLADAILRGTLRSGDSVSARLDGDAISFVPLLRSAVP
ncbi:AAA family ATPase [Vulgatibacter incomptus]|uniref:ATP-dependent Clp protease ATP-binding subunit ClpA n=1 Tax=Vulgatibacter incomptus TaxID=1391653 RepID=A0A0K1PAP1_9BACT|nr:ATP-dependent Clp protease ATP-binding subunit [Vulgatibacter incomptus]AKU90481.1 ATP-dependent Clp protease ATP-binding subunit ClpA [Vulgatibacter incomptus]